MNTLKYTTLIFSLLIVSTASAQYYYPNSYNYSNYSYNTDYYDYNSNYSYPNYYSGNYNYLNYSNYNYNSNYNNYSYTTITPTTQSASNLAQTTATVNGYVNYSSSGYNNSQSYAWFEYGTSYNSLYASTNKTPIYSSTSVNAYLTNLRCGQTYYFRVVTSGQNGTQYGSTLSFMTSACYTNNYYSNYYPYYNPNNYNNSWQQYPVNIPTNCVQNRGWRY